MKPKPEATAFFVFVVACVSLTGAWAFVLIHLAKHILQ